MKTGDIWLVQLDPTVGSEIQKTRPCVVISPDEMNAHLRTVIDESGGCRNISSISNNRPPYAQRPARLVVRSHRLVVGSLRGLLRMRAARWPLGCHWVFEWRRIGVRAGTSLHGGRARGISIGGDGRYRSG